jgi:hypothetical protein
MHRFGLVLLLAWALPAAAAPDAAIVVVPNADGVLDLAGAMQAQAFDATPNPFRDRYHPLTAIQERPIAITAVLIGRPPTAPSAVVNGELCSAGDQVEGLTITAITADTLELRLGDILLRVPVTAAATRVRLLR